MEKYILALDAGTSSVRAILFDKNQNIIASAAKEIKGLYPKTKWVEQEPLEIFTSQVATITEVLSLAQIKATQVDSIGITNQRETIIVWDKITGKPIYNAIVWQCSRSIDRCKELINMGYEPLIQQKTGLKIDSYFSATKIEWILQNVKGAREKADQNMLLCGTIDTWLMYKLTDGEIFATDYTNASRTMLFNIHTLSWDEELLNIFNIPASMLPTVYPSSHYFGDCANTYLPSGLKICAVAGDQQASLFGQKCFNIGDVKNTFGTGGFLLMNIGTNPYLSKNGLLTTLACSTSDKPIYALEGSIFISGALIKWLIEELGIINSPSECTTLAHMVDNNNGCYIVPAFVGIGAPYWDSNCSGIITGLTRSTNKNHIARATLEAMAYQTYDIIKAMEADTLTKANNILVDGGGANSNFLLQFLADITNCKVIKPECIETTALGVAFLAGLKSNFWKNIDEILNSPSASNTYTSKSRIDETRKNLKGWKVAIKRALHKVEAYD